MSNEATNAMETSRRLEDLINRELDKEAKYRRPETAEEREEKLFQWIMEIVHMYNLKTIDITKGYGKCVVTYYGAYSVSRSWYDFQNLKKKMDAVERINVEDFGSKCVLTFKF